MNRLFSRKKKSKPEEQKPLTCEEKEQDILSDAFFDNLSRPGFPSGPEDFAKYAEQILPLNKKKIFEEKIKEINNAEMEKALKAMSAGKRRRKSRRKRKKSRRKSKRKKSRRKRKRSRRRKRRR